MTLPSLEHCHRQQLCTFFGQLGSRPRGCLCTAGVDCPFRMRSSKPRASATRCKRTWKIIEETVAVKQKFDQRQVGGVLKWCVVGVVVRRVLVRKENVGGRA